MPLGERTFIRCKINIPKVNREANRQALERCEEVTINRDDKEHKKKRYLQPAVKIHTPDGYFTENSFSPANSK